VLHAGTNGSKVCGLDIKNEQESESLWRTIGQVIEWAFDAAEQASGLL